MWYAITVFIVETTENERVFVLCRLEKLLYHLLCFLECIFLG